MRAPLTHVAPAPGRAGPDPRQPPACVPLPRRRLPAAAEPGAAGGGLRHCTLRASAALQREGGRPRSACPDTGWPLTQVSTALSVLACACAFKTLSPSQGGFPDRVTPALGATSYQPGASPGRLSLAQCPRGSHQPNPTAVSPGRRRNPPSALILPPLPPPRLAQPGPPPLGFLPPRAHPQGSIYINDFARVVSSDQEAVNGVLHFIDRVLLPPEVLHWEADAAPAPRVGPGCGPGTLPPLPPLPPLPTSLLIEPLSPEKLHRCCRDLRLQDLQWPRDGTAPVCELYSVCPCACVRVYTGVTVGVCADTCPHT